MFAQNFEIQALLNKSNKKYTIKKRIIIFNNNNTLRLFLGKTNPYPQTCTGRLKETLMNNIFKGFKNAVSNFGSGGGVSVHMLYIKLNNSIWMIYKMNRDSWVKKPTLAVRLYIRVIFKRVLLNFMNSEIF